MMHVPGKRHRQTILAAVILVSTMVFASGSGAQNILLDALKGRPGAAPPPAKPSELSQRLPPDAASTLAFGAYESACEAKGNCEVTRPISPDPHNMDGIWRNYVARLTARPDMGAREDGLAPYKPKAEKILRRALEMDVKGTPMAPSEIYCRPEGTAKDVTLLHLIDILQTPDRIYMVYDDRSEVRTIFLNRSHPKKLKPTYMGDSVGHWEGDTLVVDTIGSNGRTWLDYAGSPHSNQLHIVEHYRKIDGGKALENMVTYEDPEFYTRPFTLHIVYEWRPNSYVPEKNCEQLAIDILVNGVIIQ